MTQKQDILLTQQQIQEGIENLIRNFKKDGAERKTPTYLKQRIDTLNAYWAEFQTNHTLLYQFEDYDDLYFTGNKFQQVKELYQDALSLIQGYEPPKVLTQKRAKSPITPAAAATKAPTIQVSSVEQLPVLPSTSTQLVSQASASKTEDLMRKQRSNFKAFARTLSCINLENIHEKWEFEDILKSLEARWKTIDSTHWDLDSECASFEKEYEQTFEIYEKQFQDIKKALNSKMWSVSHKEKSTPKMDLPTFSGAYQYWTSFKDLFTEVIHDNKNLSNAQKMQYLKSKVKGEAEKLIQHLTISSDNYDIAWSILNNRYNNKKLIFTSHINTILNLPTMQYQSAATIKKVHDTANECLNAIQKLGVDITSWDPILVHLLAQKLDTDSYNDYLESVEEPRELPKFDEFMRFLESKFTALESARRKQERPGSDQQRGQTSFKSQQPGKSNYQNFNPRTKPHYSNNTYNSTVRTNKIPKYVKCPLCKNDHGLFHCQEFVKLQPHERRNLVSKHNLCVNCLYDHKGKPCKSDKKCLQCYSHHHTMLHDTSVNTTTKKMSDSEANSTNKKEVLLSSNVSSMENISQTLLATAQLKVKSKDGSEVVLRALIDPGSQISIIHESSSQLLGLPRLRCSGVIFGLGAQENSCRGAINLICTSTVNDYTFDAQVFVMKKLVNNLPSKSFAKPSSWTHLEGIPLADPDYNISRPIDILLGADVYSKIMLNGIIKGDETQPMAQQSRLGWILCGNIKSYQCNVVLNDLDEIKQFWEIEDIGESSQLSTEDDLCLQQYKRETIRQEDGRYVVRLPLHEDIEEKLGQSKPRATAQFLQLEKRFKSSTKLSQNYKSFMKEYEELHHMQECNDNMKAAYYLPHHCVERNSPSTPLRVIFNASAKTTTGLSLNDLMYKGPNLQADLQSLILRWRQFKIAMTADIEKMFRMILCHKDDQKYQNILWRSQPEQPIKQYALQTVTYGTKAAPFLAMMTLKQLAQDEQHNYPEASDLLQNSFYTDDFICSVNDFQTANRIKNDLVSLLASGGFNLTKWRSNETKLLQDSKETSLSNTEAYYFRHHETAKTLGLSWNPNEDNFTFHITIDIASTKPVTKRTLLSEISKIFDPMGWLNPVTTKLKLLFQMVWQTNLHWDDRVPDTICSEWNKIKSQLNEINNIKIPRWLNIKKGDEITLHGFCDSSIYAYSCVIYTTTNTGKVVIVAAKSRLVPSKKTVTLPRLELCAAVLLSNLMKKVLQCLSTHNVTFYGWSDSTAVLGWLHGDPSRWNAFVSNRVKKIIETIPPSSWFYVKSADNPADCASRGILPSLLKTHPLWWKGPEWLTNFRPTQQQTYKTNEETRTIRINALTNVTIRHSSDVIENLINKHSSLTRVTRVIAWILRAVSRRDRQRPNYLTASEIKRASSIILLHVQQSAFTEEISRLLENKEINRKSKLLPLNPYIDSEGLLRVGGRINNAYIASEQKNPVIVPHDGHFTNILIDQAHNLTFHGGARVTSARLRRQFWVIGGNRAVKKRIFNCVKCRRHNPILQKQLMADLPAARCNPTRPFYHTGVDYTGHIDVKTNKGRGVATTKGYIAVFVCMATKAVHLELVSDLTSSAFLAALRRLSARKGAPGHLYSDNATNFTKSKRILTHEYCNLQKTLEPEFFSAIADMNIEWHLTAPSWPSSGGLWERAVRSLKFHLRRVVGEQKLTYEEMSTLLAELEACLNSRPLLPMTEDPDDLNYLTPSHFLSSGPTLTIVETERDERTRWQLVQRIFKDIWKRWQSEYLTQISPRGKWLHKKPNMKINDLVIIHDSNLPAGKWALGRVIELHEGKDGHVRVVSLRTKNGIVKRPVVKLSKLPVQTETNLHESADTNNQKPEKSEENLRNKATRPRTIYKTACNVIWLLTTLLMFVSPARCDYNLISMNLSQSMYFDKVAEMHLIRDEWKLIVYYDLKPYWNGIQTFNTYSSTLQAACAYNKTKPIDLCNMILLQLRHDYSELMHYNTILLDQKLLSRQRRGLINGVGYIANSLFGVLDDNFAKQYEEDIETIMNNEKHLFLLWKNQTSILEAENNLLKRVEDSMEKQFQTYNKHINELSKAAFTIATDVSELKNHLDFILMTTIAKGVLINLKDLQEILLETITDIHNGNFNIHLLSPQQLTEELNMISGQLSKDLTLPIDNIQTDLRKLYQLLKVKARMTKKYFIFEIKIPLVSRDSYDIYQLHPVPQRSLESMVKIVPIADYVSVNLQKDAYIPMAKNELQWCIPNDQETLLCQLQRPVYHLDTKDQLCTKSVEKDECQTEQTICRDMWTQLYKVNTYLYFCCEERTIRIICGYQITAIRVTSAGIIRLGNDCVIKGDKFTIYSHSPRSNSLKIQAEELKFDIAPINSIYNLTLPKISTTYNPELSDVRTAQDNIDKGIKQMKKEELSELPISSYDVHQYVLLYILASVALLATAIYLWRCMKARSSLALGPVAAMTVPEPVIHLQPIPTTRSLTPASSRVVQPTHLDKASSPFGRKQILRVTND